MLVTPCTYSIYKDTNYCISGSDQPTFINSSATHILVGGHFPPKIYDDFCLAFYINPSSMVWLQGVIDTVEFFCGKAESEQSLSWSLVAFKGIANWKMYTVENGFHRTQGCEFSLWFSERIAHFMWAKEQNSDSLFSKSESLPPLFF